MSNPRGIHRRLPINLTPNLIRRFWAGVDKKGPDDCWPWLRAPRNGYGAIKSDGKVISAHRLSYVIAYGEPKDGGIVRHTCDNRLCCNPAHLIVGTPTDNVHDMQDRGQFHAVSGELSPHAILTEPTVRAIWEIRKLTSHGAMKIARQLKVPVDAVKGVLERKSWKHLAPPA